MNEYIDALVLLIVIGLRVIVPLAVFRYPLPTIIAALIIDAADKSILEAFTNLNLDFYQSYDKALDIYYLSLAYIATFRNWPELTAFGISRFLWYYRLVGTTLFELTGFRALLLIFPNVFEYFFIYVEAARTRWSAMRLRKYHLFVAAAVIWVVIKLPQEYWIHIAQLDFTDFLKETILGVPLTATWGEAINENLWIVPVLVVIAVAGYFGLRALENRLPGPDWPTSFDANLTADQYVRTSPVPLAYNHWRTGLLEKLALVALISIIFASMLPNINATPLQMTTGVVFVILGNALISHWLAGRGVTWKSFGIQFAALATLNFVLGLIYVLILPTFDGQARLQDVLFFTLLLTLLVSFYDRYRAIHDLRRQEGKSTGYLPARMGQSR
jgi:hypothetical protein